jgi:hypothetical protein
MCKEMWTTDTPYRVGVLGIVFFSLGTPCCPCLPPPKGSREMKIRLLTFGCELWCQDGRPQPSYLC